MKVYFIAETTCSSLLLFILLSITSPNGSWACDEVFTLAERRDQADIIVSGIATSTSDTKATVQIIKVLRDKFSLLSGIEDGAFITVGGFKNPLICKTELTLDTVQIIPIAVQNGNEYYLNSSVLDVSIEALNTISEASYNDQNICSTFSCPAALSPVCTTSGQEFTNRCELDKYNCHNNASLSVQVESACNPCESVKCPSNTKCKIDYKTRKAVCSCGENCLTEVKTVCGADGYDYINECELQRHACLTNRKLEIVARHSCSDLSNNPCSSITCSNYAECRRSVNNPGTAVCECPFVCDPIYEPVCAENMIDWSKVQFENECNLRLKSCTEQQNYKMLYYGPCSHKNMKQLDKLCEDKECELGTECSINKYNESICICSSSCSGFGYEPVCGSDGRTYPNSCELKRSACSNKKDELKQIMNKACPNACNDVTCNNYAECKTDLSSGKAKCVCPNECSLADIGSGRVCGSDGQFYQSLCELKKVSCHSGKFSTVSNYRLCTTDDLCTSKTCHKYGRCQKGNCLCDSCEGVEEKAVCGNDGITYDNECEMKRIACEENSNVSVEHYGRCISGSSKNPLAERTSLSQNLEWQCSENCIHGSCFQVDGIWQCRCPKCEDEPPLINTLCGEDNVTYRSRCHFMQSMCISQQQLGILHQGACDSVGQCPFNSEKIRNSNGSGFLSCGEHDHCPVNSDCYLNNCCFYQSKSEINCSLQLYGCCEDQVTFALGPRRQGCPEKCLCNELGAYGNRCDIFNNCVCRKGVTGKKCDRCDYGYWNFTRMEHHPFLGCQECNCNLYGSERSDCDQSTGECLCKTGVFGKKCNLCPTGLLLSPLGCLTKQEFSLHQFFPSCQDVQCSNGATCVQREGFAQCECPVTCPEQKHYTPVVCASDGKTYENECEMVISGCPRRLNLSVVFYGHCSSDVSTLDISSRTLESKAVEVPLSDSTDVLDRCSYVECEFGGRCVSDGRSQPKCICKIGTRGENCAQQVEYRVPSFTRSSFLELEEVLVDASGSNWSLFIKPDGQSGIVLYAGPDSFFQPINNTQFLILYLEDGLLKCKYNFDNELQMITVDQPVEVGRWYFVEVSFYGKSVYLEISSKADGNNAAITQRVSRVSMASGAFKAPLQIGGGSVLMMKNAEHILKSLSIHGGFEGCVTSLRVDTSDVDISHPVQNTTGIRIKTGFGIDSCKFNPCTNSPCANGGQCRVIDSFSYGCSCAEGYGGENCVNRFCTPDSCQNGGICEISTNKVKCLCPLQTKGDFCEKKVRSKNNEIFMPSFNLYSWMSSSWLQGKQYEGSLKIEMWIFIRKLKGLLFYTNLNDNSEYIIIELVAHRVSVTLKFKKHLLKLKSLQKLNNKSWNKITVTGRENTFELLINDTPSDHYSLYSTKIGKYKFSNQVYLGGLPDGSYKLGNSNVVSLHGFKGLVQKLDINGVLLLGNKTIEELAEIFERSANVSEWTKHDCYENMHNCEREETCLPNFDSYICHCNTNRCAKRESRTLDNFNFNLIQEDHSYSDAISLNGGKRYVIYNSIDKRITSQEEEKYEFSFRSSSTYGLMMWSKEASMIDYFSVGLLGGFLHVQIELGAGKSDLFSNQPLNDGEWHFVSIERSPKNIKMKVDDDESASYTKLNEGAWVLDTDGYLYIGGLSGSGENEYGSFVGCIKNLFVGGKPVNFFTHTITTADSDSIDVCLS